LTLCLALLIFGLSALLVLRLSVVVPALLLSLPALLILFPATTFVLGLLGLFLFLLLTSFFTLQAPVFPVLRLLRLSEPTRARQRHCTHSRRQREATKVTTFHDYLLRRKGLRGK
jgi:uncharacterized protein (DUF58 family)